MKLQGLSPSHIIPRSAQHYRSFVGTPGCTGASAVPRAPILELGRQQNWKQFPSGLLSLFTQPYTCCLSRWAGALICLCKTHSRQRQILILV